MERGWDPQVKKYFMKIMNSVSLGLLWMMTCAAGIYYGLATGEKPLIVTIVFYTVIFLGLLLLLRYLYKTWRNG